MINSIYLQIQAFTKLSANEIIELIPESVLSEIKSKNAHPFFQAYSFIHEGISTPTILGNTARPISWTRKAIQSIKNSVLKGVKFFLGHNADNSTDNREYLGEIVADTQKEIDGKLHHIVIGYFPDKDKVSNLDICSQEASWDFIEYAGNWIADKLNKLTGIALSSSKTDSPAFENAKRLGMVQAFAENTDDNGRDKKMDLSIVRFEELAAEIKNRKTWPSQLFTEDDLRKDNAFVKLFTESENLAKENKQLKETIESEKKSKAEIERKANLATSKDRLANILKEMKLTEKQVKYLNESLDENVQDVSDAGLKIFIDKQLAQYAKVVKSIGVDDKLPTQSHSSENKDDLTKAENNELLKEDLTE